MQSLMTVPSGLSIFEQVHSFISLTDRLVSRGSVKGWARSRARQSSTRRSELMPTKHLSTKRHSSLWDGQAGVIRSSGPQEHVKNDALFARHPVLHWVGEGAAKCFALVLASNFCAAVLSRMTSWNFERHACLLNSWHFWNIVTKL